MCILSLEIRYFLSLHLGIELRFLLSCSPLVDKSCIAPDELVSWAEATSLAYTQSLVALLVGCSLTA